MMSEINKMPIKNTELAQQDLLEVSQNISLYYAPTESNNSLVLLPIDPLHLHAYWDIHENQENLSKAKIERDEVLRVYSQEICEGIIQCNPVINVPIQSFKSKKIIRLPISLQRKTYFASIGELTADEEFIPIITSKSTDYFQAQKEVQSPKQWGHVIENMLLIAKNKKPSHHVKTHFSGIGIIKA